MNRSGAAFISMLVASWLVFVAAVYLPDVGRGFVKDDFGWIEAGRIALDAPTAALLGPRTGFYRPIVDLSFALDYLAHGTSPRGYGFTNLALYVACMAALWTLCRVLKLSQPAATLAAFLWGVNPHGINMALVWISGRTSLCLTLFALLSAIALMKRSYVWMAAFLVLALASKEEAIVLPVILFAWHWVLVADTDDRRRIVVALAAPLALYFALRAHAGAFTPASAPSYYQFSVAPLFVLRNLIEYADRGATAAIAALALAAAAYRLKPALDRDQRRLLAACAVWFAGAYGLTLFLPVRSSLYAVFPSVAPAIACAAIVEAMTARAAAPRRQTLRFGLVIAATLLALVPVYRSRNGQYVEPARLSERALVTMHPHMVAATPGSVILLHDVDDATSNFAGAFGVFASSAVRLHSGRELTAWIDPPPEDWQLAGLRAPQPRVAALAFAVERERIFKVDGSLGVGAP